VREARGGGVALVEHPDTPARAVSGVVCTHVWRNPGEWRFDFHVDAPAGALRLPAPTAPDRTDGLWYHTCFELFLLDPLDGAYLEFNFSPSGQWAAYQFDGYRAGMRELDVSAPSILGSGPAHAAAGIAARLRALGLDEETIRKFAAAAPPMPAPATGFSLSAICEHPGLWREIAVRAAISAVIEEADGTKSYWALAHPPGKPDFHHADCFDLDLEPVL